jgi:hypothetical protein
MTRQWRDDEEGASLILVILFVLVFAVVIGAVLDFASTGLRTSENVASIRNQQHAVDGAMEGAINAVRQNLTGGLDGCDYEYDSVDNSDPTVDVTCALDTTVNPGDPESNQPKYAVLTGRWRTPTDKCAGFLMTGNNEMAIRGGIFSNGPIAIGDYEDGDCSGDTGAGNQRVMKVSFNNALARGRCTPAATIDDRIVMVTPFTYRSCNGNAGEGDDPAGDEAIPEYVLEKDTIDELADPNGYDPLPTCVNSRVVQFEPGIYTEIPRYHVERANCNGTHDIWYFPPGTYYFDFPSDDAEWVVNPDNVIGGTLKSPYSNLTTLASSWNGLTDRHVCEDDPYQTDDPGVQFIFGGASRLTTQSNNNGVSGTINICAGQSSISGFNQRVVLYGLQSKTVQPTQDNRPNASSDDLENQTAPTGTFDNPGNAQRNDNDRATKSFSAASALSDNVVFSNFEDEFDDVSPAASVDGATITGLQLEIRHSEGGDEPDKLAKTVQLTFPSGTHTIDIDANNNGCTTSNGAGGDSVETCDLLDLDILEDPFLWKELKDMAATYTVDPSLLDTIQQCTGQGQNRQCVDVNETATASLNSIVLKVDYRAPGLEALSSSTPFLSTTTNPVALFMGTFFTPFADLAVNVHNGGTTEFARGVIANHIKGNANSSSKQVNAPFSLPGGGTESRVFLFKAFVGGKLRLTVRAAYDDVDGIAGRRVHIYDWVVNRG